MAAVDERDGRSHAFFRVEIDQESLAIRRHGVLLLVERRHGTAGDANRFITGDLQGPQVKASLRIVAAEQKKASIGGPISCHFGLIQLLQQFIGSSAAR